MSDTNDFEEDRESEAAERAEGPHDEAKELRARGDQSAKDRHEAHRKKHRPDGTSGHHGRPSGERPE